ncbi:hypothetical protein IC582_030301 [Cucumis melo]
MAATTSINPNLTPPSSSSYPHDLFSEFVFRGTSRSRFRFPPSKSAQQNPNPYQDSTQHSPISTLYDLQTSEPNNHHNKSLASPSSEADEPPILTLEDLQNGKLPLQSPKKPSLARRVLSFYREFGFDKKLLQATSHSVLNSEPVQEGTRVVSRYFQNSRSTQQRERIVSRYFQKSVKERAAHYEDENDDGNLTEQPSKRSSKRRRKDVDPSSVNSKTNHHSMGKTSRSVQKSGTDTRVRIVSGYFQYSEKSLEMDREVSPSLQNSKSNQQEEKMVSRFFLKSGKQQAVNNQEEATEQLNQCAKSVKRVRKPVNERKQKNKTSSTKPRTTLTAAELFLEAYRRKSPDDTWKPPPSGTRLLQHDHAYDPWRVLVICMLLNRTSGRQAKEVIPKLFSLCPNPKATLEVSREQIEDIIRPLGLYRKRSRTMHRLSEMYLKESWSHVTQLPGVGKYGADAHAIFCTGYWSEVEPKDHMLNYYWDFLHSIKHLL